MSKKTENIITLVDNVRIDDNPTSYTSAELAVAAWSYCLFYITIDSTLAPTDIQIILEFSNNDGSTWFQYRNDFWGDLRYEDTATASGINHCISSPLAGSLMRVRVVGTGTTSTAYFDISVHVQPYNV